MPNIHNVVDDVQYLLFPNREVRLHLRSRDEGRYILYLQIPYAAETGKIEFIIEGDPDDPNINGAVLRNGSVSERTVTRIMNSIMERL